jgi:ribosome-binding protein aMBF1 (putative translation factor)
VKNIKNKIWVYNTRRNFTRGNIAMPKKLDLDITASFGQRMAKLRHAAGYSQRDLA